MVVNKKRKESTQVVKLSKQAKDLHSAKINK